MGGKHGPIPPGMCVCHKCNNPACINIDHLFWGTHLDNMKDMVLTDRLRRPSLKGEKHPSAKLTEYQVKVIRLAANLGCKGVWLANKYGMSESHVSGIKTGLYWR